MFKFDFNLDDEDDANDLNVALPDNSDDGLAPATVVDSKPVFKEISISQLLDALPQKISYSPFSIPLSSCAESLVLPRRDLFDARFQLISEDQLEDESNMLRFFDAPSDLVPGVYEGGLKTWECSLDLVDYLESSALPTTSFIGKHILEVGCGTAVPSMYLLYKILSSPVSTDRPPETHIHLQDYNSAVLELVTLPNLFITWCVSATSTPYHAIMNSERVSPSMPSEITITPELKTAFLSTLQGRNISIRFFSGLWESFDVASINPSQKYDLVLTSETIYRMDSLPSLVSLLYSACTGQRTRESDRDAYTCLVAAKVVYFGVGGGVIDFTNYVEEVGGREGKGKVETVWETKTGVKKKVLSVVWE